MLRRLGKQPFSFSSMRFSIRALSRKDIGFLEKAVANIGHCFVSKQPMRSIFPPRLRDQAGGGISLALLIVVGLVGCRQNNPPFAEESKAEKFVLVDDSGATIGVWGRNELGEVGLSGPCNEQDGCQYFLGVDALGMPSLVLRDRHGVDRIVMGLGLDEMPYLALRDEAGNSRAVMGLGSSMIEFVDQEETGNDQDNEPRQLVVTPGGQPAIMLWDALSKKRFSVSYDSKNGSYNILLFDHDEEISWRAIR